MLMDYSGFLLWLSGLTAPFVKLMGLRGESALVLLTSGFLNIYSAIAVIQSINFSLREITIMALMCLIAHNLIIETAVQKKTGSSGIWMVFLRIIAAIVGGIILNFILPPDTSMIGVHPSRHIVFTFAQTFFHWSQDTFILILKIIVIIWALNFLQRILDEFSITLLLSRIMSPFLRLFGLPPQASFMWLIANIIGLAWGSAVLIDQTEQGKITGKEANILNHHIAISHSLLEDTLLFAALGVSIYWLIFPRLLLAFIAVWLFRLFFSRKDI
jgi:spore maturation protein SpmB